MKKIAFALCATLAFSVPAFAQSHAAASPDQGAGESGGKGGKLKELVQGCRSQLKSQGMKGKEMRQAVMDCVVKENPKMAGVMKCRMDAKDKGLSGDEMKSFVKDCRKNANHS